MRILADPYHLPNKHKGIKRMTTYEIMVTVTIEASNREDAEELLIELFDTDPAIAGWHIEPAEAVVSG